MSRQESGRLSLAAFCIFVVVITVGVACKSRAPVIHQGVGVVEEVDEGAAQIQINHEEIKGYMPAMSMPYRVKDKTLLGVAKPGDKVEFTMEDSSAGIFIIELKKAESKKNVE